MIRTFLYLALAGLLVLAALQIADIPGEVAFDWQGWRIVLPAPLLVLALIIFAAISALIYRIWRGFTRTPGAIVAAHRRARRERGYRALTQGMVAVAAGDAQEARRQAKRADVLLNEPPLTMLLSAQTAQLNGDEQAAKRYFTAMLEREETAFLGLRGLLIQAQKDGDRAEALRLAERARRLQPKTPWVLGTLYDLHVAEKDWRSAAGLLDGWRSQGPSTAMSPAGDARRWRSSALKTQDPMAMTGRVPSRRKRPSNPRQAGCPRSLPRPPPWPMAAKTETRSG